MPWYFSAIIQHSAFNISKNCELKSDHEIRTDFRKKNNQNKNNIWNFEWFTRQSFKLWKFMGRFRSMGFNVIYCTTLYKPIKIEKFGQWNWFDSWLKFPNDKCLGSSIAFDSLFSLLSIKTERSQIRSFVSRIVKRADFRSSNF